MSRQTIRIGTRGSRLALWQAHRVAEAIQQTGAATEVVTISTKGDQVLDVAIAKIGSKGVFTEEIEAQLQAGHIDIAVHSAKDMPSVLPDGFELIAFGEREPVHDVLVNNGQPIDLGATTPLRIGTSSTRRVACLKHYYPHLQPVDMRGNLQTRMRKLNEGQCDALLLAYAGVHRMEYDQYIAADMPLHQFVPAVGQGSVAIEACTDLNPALRQQVAGAFNHAPTHTRIAAERAFLRRLEGGCSIPAFALANLTGADIALTGGLVSLNGQTMIKHTVQGPAQQAQSLGSQLAEQVLANGGQHLLAQIRQALNAND